MLMITHTMSHIERIAEIGKDLEAESFILQSRRCYNAYAKYAKQKRARTPYRFRKKRLMMFPKLYQITSKRRNRWIIVFRAYKNGIIMRNICRYETKSGFIACEFKRTPIGDGSNRSAFLFIEHTPHFFRRYFERHELHGASLKEQVEYFFLHNPSLRLASYDGEDFIEEEKSPVAQYYLDGLGLGSIFLDYHLVRMNTYLPYDYTEKGNRHQRRLTTHFEQNFADIHDDDPSMQQYNQEYRKMIYDALERRGKQVRK